MCNLDLFCIADMFNRETCTFFCVITEKERVCVKSVCDVSIYCTTSLMLDEIRRDIA